MSKICIITFFFKFTIRKVETYKCNFDYNSKILKKILNVLIIVDLKNEK